MFFDIILLNAQHGGRFGTAWLAATRGLRFVPKRQIKETNIVKLCEELILFIANASTSPHKRFSLRLSAILMHGVLKIFHAQVISIESEVFSLITTIHVPYGVGSVDEALHRGLFESPPTPIPRTRKKRQPKAIKWTPDTYLPGPSTEIVVEQLNIEDILLPTARADEISIREEMPRRQEDIEDEFGIGILSEKEVEEFNLALSQDEPAAGTRYTSSDSAPPQGPIVVEAMIHAPREGIAEKLVVRQPVREVSERIPAIAATAEPEDILDVEMGISVAGSAPIIHVEEVSQAPIIHVEEVTQAPITHVEEVTQAPIIHVEEVIQAVKPPPVEPLPGRQVVEEVERAAEQRVRKALRELQLDEIETPRARVSLNDKEWERLRIKHPRQRFVQINRYNEIPDQEEPPEPELLCQNMVVQNLFDLFLPVEDDEGVNAVMRRPSTLPSLKDSIEMRRTGTSSAQGSTLQSVSEVQQSVLPPETPEVEPFGTRRATEDAPGQISVEQPVIPPSTPRKRKRGTKDEDALRIIEQVTQAEAPVEAVPEVPQEIPMEMVSRVREDTAPIPHETPMEVPVEAVQEIPQKIPMKMASQARAPRVLELPPSDFKERQQRIIDIILAWEGDAPTIEDVCEKPINRLNITRAFADLLTLSASNFVILSSEENSTQLKSIEKGPKLLGP